MSIHSLPKQELSHSINWRDALWLGVQRAWRRFWFGFIIIGFALVMLISILWAWPDYIQPKLDEMFAIEDVQIAGHLEFASAKSIQKVIQSKINHTPLYKLDTKELVLDLIGIAWIESAVVTRSWPHELQIQLTETIPIAVWNEEKILSNRGDLFKPSSVALHNELPRLYGEVAEVSFITDMYRQASKVLRQAQLKLTQVKFLKGLVWHLEVEDKSSDSKGFVLVLDGEKSVSRLYRFIEHYPSLKRMEQMPARVDLRYPTGMAVSWQEANEIADQ